MTETAIADHALIGDLQTAALVTTDGSIDWLCLPRFDSPSVFGALLDDDRGGHFRVHPAGTAYTTKQTYFPDTAVLVTRFFTEAGVGQVVDFMPPSGDTATTNHRLVRMVHCVRGRMSFEIDVAPRFDYGRHPHQTRVTEGGAVFASNGSTLTLHVVREPGDEQKARVTVEDEDLHASLDLEAGEVRGVVLESGADGPPRVLRVAEIRALFDETVRFWRSWVAGVGRPGQPRPPVAHRLVEQCSDLGDPDHARRAVRPRLEHHAPDLARLQIEGGVQVVVLEGDAGLLVIIGLAHHVQGQCGAVRREHGAALGDVGPVRVAAVVEAWGDVDVEAHPAAHALHHPDEPVVGGGRVPRRWHEVDDLADARLGEEAGHQDGGVGEVRLLRRVLEAGGMDPEVPAAGVVEQSPEHAGGVEPGEAQPVDRPVGRDEGCRLQVSDECVVGDGGLGHHGFLRDGRTVSGGCTDEPVARGRAPGSPRPR